MAVLHGVTEAEVEVVRGWQGLVAAADQNDPAHAYTQPTQPSLTTHVHTTLPT